MLVRYRTGNLQGREALSCRHDELSTRRARERYGLQPDQRFVHSIVARLPLGRNDTRWAIPL